MAKKLLGLMLLMTWAGRAPASDWRLLPEVLTDVPVHTGAGIKVEGPLRLRLATSLGVLPGPYVDLINQVVMALGGYDQPTADLVRKAIQNSLVWRIHAGWRPFADYGFYFELGYGLVTLGGGLEGEEVIAVATGRTPPPPPPGIPDRRLNYSVASRLHMLDLEIGWRFKLWKGLSLRLALGLAATLGASTHVQPDFRPLTTSLTQVFTGQAEDYLNDIYRTYVHTPTLSLSVGYLL